MSVNKYQPHVLVLPEDDANRQLAVGFSLAVDFSCQRQMRILPPAGGWNEVLNLFKSEHLAEMDRWPNRLMVLLIDCDGNQDRLKNAKEQFPSLAERVFVLGTLTEPEALRRDLGSYEAIGSRLAQDCREDTSTAWGHELLKHNSDELDRMREYVRPILF